MRRTLALTLVTSSLLVSTALSVAPASAAGPRYATPSPGPSADCSAAKPCSLATAFNDAVEDQEVVIGPGTYDLGTTELLNEHAGLTVHGVVGQPRPLIMSSADSAITLAGDDAGVRDLQVEHTGGSVGLYVTSTDSVVERVVVRSSGQTSCFGAVQGETWRDSTCVNTGERGVAFEAAPLADGATTVRLRNVTSIATGKDGYGLVAAPQSSNGGQELTLDLRNVIVRGTKTDVYAQNILPGNAATIVLASSNYATTDGTDTPQTSITAPGTGTNRTAEPVFSDSFGRPAAGSPTIDAGSPGADNGTTDVDGRPRVQGSSIDVGAAEFVPPASPPAAPDTAILSGPKAKTTKHKARFTFGGAGAATFTCQLDTKAAVACPASYAVKVKKKGKHVLTVTATSAQGLLDPTPAVYRWKIR